MGVPDLSQMLQRKMEQLQKHKETLEIIDKGKEGPYTQRTSNDANTARKPLSGGEAVSDQHTNSNSVKSPGGQEKEI